MKKTTDDKIIKLSQEAWMVLTTNLSNEIKEANPLFKSKFSELPKNVQTAFICANAAGQKYRICQEHDAPEYVFDMTFCANCGQMSCKLYCCEECENWVCVNCLEVDAGVFDEICSNCFENKED
jgi:hypothetical protein